MSRFSLSLSALALLSSLGVTPAWAEDAAPTTTPIKHVILVIGENRTFDHLFGTYLPPAGESVDNLVSRGVVTPEGLPGPNFATAHQLRASHGGSLFQLSPDGKMPYGSLPPPMTGTAHSEPSDEKFAPFKTTAAAARYSQGLPAETVPLTTSGATGQPLKSPDKRFGEGQRPPNGPFPLSDNGGYDAYTGDVVHRFYQMWQQMDCAAAQATPTNPSGCRSDLFPWVGTTVGSGRGRETPDDFNEQGTGEGANAMGFFNVNKGDMPYFKSLAEHYALSDNFHQGFIGGTANNHTILAHGDAIWYSDGQGHAATPPANQIANPNPKAGLPDDFTNDGLYTACADLTQPGAKPIRDYLGSLAAHPDPKCEAGKYYLLNNRFPGYFADGSINHDAKALPPSTLRSIGDALSERKISWAFFGDGWKASERGEKFETSQYCDFCNPFQFLTSIMTDPTQRTTHMKDVSDFYESVAAHALPAVSYVKPNAIDDGHPASSKVDLFEGFCRKLIETVQADPALWSGTAIIITFDEGGGYYDGGYIQPVDFFGDGTRIPTLVVSPYSQGGHVVHSYYDHASVLKFIERNWSLAPLTSRSRDNLPNPIASKASPYVPANSPAIGDLMEMFSFKAK